MEEIDFGKALTDLAPERLRFDGSRALLAACLRHPYITVRDLRALTRADDAIADGIVIDVDNRQVPARNPYGIRPREPLRSEEHTSELQSLMRISYAVFCLKKKNKTTHHIYHKV